MLGLKKVLDVAVTLTVLFTSLGSSVNVADNAPGVVPDADYLTWLPVIVGMSFEDQCGVSEGGYGIHTNRYGDRWHSVSYAVYKTTTQPEKIIVASDSSFEDMVSEGGSAGGMIIPPPAPERFTLLLGISMLEVGQTYYAKMEYSCEGVSVQTPVLSFVAREPESN